MPLLAGMNVCCPSLTRSAHHFFNNLIICTLIHKSSLPNCFTLFGARFRLNENELGEFERAAKFARIAYGNSYRKCDSKNKEKLKEKFIAVAIEAFWGFGLSYSQIPFPQ